MSLFFNDLLLMFLIGKQMKNTVSVRFKKIKIKKAEECIFLFLVSIFFHFITLFDATKV